MLWRLARALPDVHFLAVRGYYGRQTRAKVPNVEIIGATADMAGEVYARTKVMLIPSKAETWCRVGVEAALCGIPSIASDIPALRESLGTAGTFVRRGDFAGWRDTVRRLATDRALWKVHHLAALRRAADWDHRASLDRFASAVEALVPVGAAA